MSKSSILILIFLVGFCSFLLGRLSSRSSIEPRKIEMSSQITLVDFIERNGDQLTVNITGPGRVIWGGGFVEGDGEHLVSLGQIETENDLVLERFRYIGNSNTENFYPSLSYPARGTKVEYRRYFQTKEEAISAGFNPSKLVD